MEKTYDIVKLMEKEKKKTIATRPDKEVYIIGDRCYKVFESEKDKADVLNDGLKHSQPAGSGDRRW